MLFSLQNYCWRWKIHTHCCSVLCFDTPQKIQKINEILVLLLTNSAIYRRPQAKSSSVLSDFHISLTSLNIETKPLLNKCRKQLFPLWNFWKMIRSHHHLLRESQKYHVIKRKTQPLNLNSKFLGGSRTLFSSSTTTP